jgi:hypothetical protein
MPVARIQGVKFLSSPPFLKELPSWTDFMILEFFLSILTQITDAYKIAIKSWTGLILEIFYVNIFVDFDINCSCLFCGQKN